MSSLLIEEGHKVLIRMPSSNSKIVHIRSATQKINLGKFGTFNASSLIGKPFNAAYDIQADGNVAFVDPKSLLEELGEEIDEDESSERNNSNLKDREENQKVTVEEIARLKKDMQEGKIAANEIIKTLVNNNSSHDNKTKFAQLKFIKRKARKYSKRFEAMEPTARNLCEYYFNTKPQKTRGIRVDSLAQIMCFANVMASSNILVCDSTGGLILSALLERMTHGDRDLGGRLFAMLDGDMPNFDIVKEMNTAEGVVERTIDYLSWSRIEPVEGEEQPIAAPETTDEKALERHTKKVAAIARTRAARAKLAPTAFDGLIIVSQFEVTDILAKLIPFVGYSRPVVVHSQYKEALVPAYLMMRASPDYVNAQITDTMTREYQVPVSGLGTHPFMTTSGTGGYILSATRVYAGDGPLLTASAKKKMGMGQAAQTSKKRKL
ncbi:tRNA (adenine(58)-N(1))-methyltransferase non-catalytic subunit trm6 [Rhizoclosmatium sp. JEL0117]|nr:tRNA (adenine(58)-N(1))-methyltransferase non-catalytic subunit trm6 [Rhizoclosmatium sp. JEL0117]